MWINEEHFISYNDFIRTLLNYIPLPARSSLPKVAFWDLDDTIVNGDSTEEKYTFTGLAKTLIQSNAIPKYSSYDGYLKYTNDCEKIKHIDLRNKFISQIFKNHSPFAREVIQQHVKQVISKFFFRAAIDIMHTLNANQVENYIVSASPQELVAEVAKFLPVKKENIFGIDYREDNIHDGEGKLRRIKQISQYKQIFFAAGNSLNSDLPFLMESSKQGGRAFFINPQSSDFQELPIINVALSSTVNGI